MCKHFSDAQIRIWVSAKMNFPSHLNCDRKHSHWNGPQVNFRNWRSNGSYEDCCNLFSESTVSWSQLAIYIYMHDTSVYSVHFKSNIYIFISFRYVLVYTRNHGNQCMTSVPVFNTDGQFIGIFFSFAGFQFYWLQNGLLAIIGFVIYGPNF